MQEQGTRDKKPSACCLRKRENNSFFLNQENKSRYYKNLVGQRIHYLSEVCNDTLRTKALHAAVGAMLRVFGENQRRYIMPFFLFVFGFCASIFGMFEESFGFLPLFVGMAIAMGYDGMVGAATVAVGVGMGYSAAIMNFFTVILAQKCAELPLLSGWPFRLIYSDRKSVV